jgi:hypothetical protein
MKAREDKRFYALYSSDDIPVATFENQYELALYLGKPYRSLQSTISRVIQGKTKKVIDKKGNSYILYVYRKEDENERSN